MSDLGPARAAVELDSVGPWDHDPLVAETAEIGQRSEEQARSDPFPTKGTAHAGRAEPSEPAVVHVMRGESDDLAILLGVKDGGLAHVEGMRGLEPPDGSEVLFDEAKYAIAIGGHRAMDAVDRSHQRLSFQVQGRLRFGESMRQKKLQRVDVVRHHARREVVAGLSADERRSARPSVLQQSGADSFSSMGRRHCEQAERIAATDAQPFELSMNAHFRVALNAGAEALLFGHSGEIVRCVVCGSEELSQLGKIRSCAVPDHAAD